MKATALEPFLPAALTPAGTTADERFRTPTTVETDGGSSDEPEFAVYTDDRYGYRLAYPADWSVESDLSGVVLESRRSGAGAAVFVETTRFDPAACAATFLTELADDDHVHSLELRSHRERKPGDDHQGVVVDCTYVGDSGERWWLSYLFARDDRTGYTLGVDWNDTTGFEATAERIVASFAFEPLDRSRNPTR
ncbi:hypothetical protein [Halococcus hamelinensis]|uniref:Uncharacterized protein n=1 Tax=Halococcus hamelinensis 100A6 TaxID=1132509 RepID=M0LTQ9_9EURY|nr:hypothetical protein [Halococcus hamelinensis]EMA35794.1 hypothetical protein C447_16589 [Halococcus hamelinensis 100A6]